MVQNDGPKINLPNHKFKNTLDYELILIRRLHIKNPIPSESLSLSLSLSNLFVLCLCVFGTLISPVNLFPPFFSPPFSQLHTIFLISQISSLFLLSSFLGGICCGGIYTLCFLSD